MSGCTLADAQTSLIKDIVHKKPLLEKQDSIPAMEDDVKSDSANSAESETFCPDGAAGERYDPLGAASDNEMELRSFQE